MTDSKDKKELFPPIDPFDSFRLKVSDLHDLHVEQAGNPEGAPVLFLHGGPGAGLSPMYRQFFDPKFYRIILFDQRGSGKSTPHAELKENTTWDLVEDIEKIRNHLGIEKWVVFGGSWGSTLALAYSETHPQATMGLILRGIFLTRKEEIDWFYQNGASHLFADIWEDYLKPVAPEDRHDMVSAYYKLLTSEDESIRLNAAKAWSGWEARTLRLLPDPELIGSFTDTHVALSLARIECHYFINKSFFEHDDLLLRNADKIKNIPTVIVHGRYDVVTVFKNAWDLKKVLPHAELKLIEDAGHAANEKGIIDALISSTEKFKDLY